MTDEILVGCTEAGCDGVVRLTRSRHDDVDDGLIGLACPRGHRFDFEKCRCPRCGSRATPGEWRPPQVWTGTPPPSSFLADIQPRQVHIVRLRLGGTEIATGQLYPRGKVWWTKYYGNGRVVRESTGTDQPVADEGREASP